MRRSQKLRIAEAIGQLRDFGSVEIRECAALALEAGQMAVFEWHIPTDTVIGDPMFCRLFQVETPLASEDVFKLIHPEDLAGLRQAIRRTHDLDEDYDATFRVDRADGSTIWIGGRGRVIERGIDGAPLRMVGVNWDMTRSKEQEERVSHLVREMNHRVNNSFALMKAMLYLGGETYSDVSDFVDTLSAQIHALSTANLLVADVFLHQPTASQHIGLETVVRKVLHDLTQDADDPRIEIEIGRTMAVKPQDITPLTMILYELATNAAKNSILGEADGTLEVIVASLESGRAYVQWIERLDRPRERSEDQAALNEVALDGFILEHCLAKMNATLVQNEATATGFSFIFEFDAETSFSPDAL